MKSKLLGSGGKDATGWPTGASPIGAKSAWPENGEKSRRVVPEAGDGVTLAEYAVVDASSVNMGVG